MVKRASLIWNRTEQFLRISLQQGKVPFGHAIESKGGYAYHIEDHLLRQYVGEEKWEAGLERVEKYKEELKGEC